jgi:F0F1-type ATP synthase epsilon subunit
MNRSQINALRASLDLSPIETSDAQKAVEKARKRAQDANRAAHAQLQRDLKSLRNSGRKAK